MALRRTVFHYLGHQEAWAPGRTTSGRRRVAAATIWILVEVAAFIGQNDDALPSRPRP